MYPAIRVFFIGLALVLFPPAWGQAQQGDAPARVAILPFHMNAPSNLNYLKDGIRDMLTSRLAWKGQVEVVSQAQTEKALKGAPSKLGSDRAIAIGKQLGADYVLFGSLTALGQSVSIDAKMAPVDKGAEPVSLYVQTESMDDVIPKINRFAQDINGKVFGRAVQTTARADSSQEDFSTRNPELLIPETMAESRENISYLNPNFVEVTPDGALRQPGLWRSQTFGEAVVGMDIGDLNDDGSLELVTVSYDKLTVYERKGSGLKPVAVHRGEKVDRFVWVSTADIDRDGGAEIFVTNMKKRHVPHGGAYEHVSYGRSSVEKVSSLGFRWTGKELQKICDNQPYFLNALDIPLRGKVLLGQRKGRNDTFDDSIYEMQLSGSDLQTLNPLSVPERCNVFNFAQGDIDNDGAPDTVLIDSRNRLMVLGGGGGRRWRGKERFGASTNRIAGKVDDLRYNKVDYFYIPSPILLADLNEDDILEVVVNRSPDYSNLLPEGFKYYEQGKIVSLSWDQLGMVENWKTREIDGMVTSIRIGDLNGDGTPELIASMVMGRDMLKLWESQSTIFSYDLNIQSGEKTAMSE